MPGTSPAMTSSECCCYSSAQPIVYALGIPVFRTVAFTVGFIAQAVLTVAIFKVV
jgi:hypothetical protein